MVHGPMASSRIAHNASFSDGLATRFELWFNQCDEPGSRSSKSERHGQCLRQRNETHVRNNGLDRIWNVSSGKVSRILALVDHDARIFSQFGIKLIAAHIDG